MNSVIVNANKTHAILSHMCQLVISLGCRLHIASSVIEIVGSIKAIGVYFNKDTLLFKVGIWASWFIFMRIQNSDYNNRTINDNSTM